MSYIYSALKSWHGQLNLPHCTIDWKNNGKKLKKLQKHEQVRQWRTDACRYMASLDLRIKVHQIRGRNIRWPDH